MKRVGLHTVMPVTTGLLLGIGIGILVADGRWWPVVAIAPLGLGLAAMVRALVPAEDRRRVGAIVGLGFALHVAIAVLLFTGSLALGHGSFIPGDDGEYANVASHFTIYLQGRAEPPWVPPFWAGEAYIFGTWVYLESAIFLLTGPEVLVPIFLNGAFALATALLVFDMTRSLFDRRSAFVALVLTAFYPSLVLWSSLNLKDALALLIIAVCLWALMRFQRRPRWWPLALALAALVPMAGLRQYLFLGLSLLVPVVVALTPRLGFAPRARWTAPAVFASGLLLYASQVGVDLGPQLLETFEGERQAMGIGARTRFVEAPPVLVKEGDTFVVAAPSVAALTPATPPVPSTTGASSTPAPATSAPTTPAIVHVAPNTRIIVVTHLPAAVAPAGAVYVRPGDILVIGPPESTPAPSNQRATLGPVSGEDGVTLMSAERPVNDLAMRSFRYFPVGLPGFRWSSQHPQIDDHSYSYRGSEG